MAQHSRFRWWRARFVVVLVAMIVFGSVAACGDDDGASPEAGEVPAVDEPGFRGDQTFQQLPRFPGSEELTPASDENGVISQSFEVQDRRPRDVIRFYEDELAGQSILEPLEEIGPDSYRIDFGIEDDEGELRRLRLSTTPLEPTSTGITRAQYSLVLYADAGAIDPDQDVRVDDADG